MAVYLRTNLWYWCIILKLNFSSNNYSRSCKSKADQEGQDKDKNDVPTGRTINFLTVYFRSKLDSVTSSYQKV